MEALLFALPGMGSFLLGSYIFTCCLRSRVKMLEERVGGLEHYRNLTPAHYTPMPSAPPSQELEWGVRVI